MIRHGFRWQSNSFCPPSAFFRSKNVESASKVGCCLGVNCKIRQAEHVLCIKAKLPGSIWQWLISELKYPKETDCFYHLFTQTSKQTTLQAKGDQNTIMHPVLWDRILQNQFATQIGVQTFKPPPLQEPIIPSTRVHGQAHNTGESRGFCLIDRTAIKQQWKSESNAFEQRDVCNATGRSEWEGQVTLQHLRTVYILWRMKRHLCKQSKKVCNKRGRFCDENATSHKHTKTIAQHKVKSLTRQVLFALGGSGVAKLLTIKHTMSIWERFGT